MTWKEFKEFVDTKLEKRGISEECNVWWIDIDSDNNKDNIQVIQDSRDGSIMIG